MTGLNYHTADVPPAWAERYLRLLGLDPEPPSLAALTRLTRRHLLAVPFENVTSLLRFRDAGARPLPPLDFDALLANWERRRGGGVCYEHAWSLERMLRALGYRARAIAGQITFPGSHQAVRVELPEGAFLVDAGNGAPFFDPIPLDRTVEVRHAGLAYRFRPDDGETHLQERWIDGSWTPFCRYQLGEQSQAECDAAYRRHHCPGVSFVVGELRIVRCTAEAVYALIGAELTTFRSTGKQTEQLTEPADFAKVAEAIFDLPELPIHEALSVLADASRVRRDGAAG